MGTFLHGTLHLAILDGKDLPNLDSKFAPLRRNKDVSDPYVTVDTAINSEKTCRLCKTRVVDDNLNPQWNEKFEIDLCHKLDTLAFSVKDADLVKVQHMGRMHIRAEEILSQGGVSGWFQLMTPKGKYKGSLRIDVRFTAAGECDTLEVPNVPFKETAGSKVKLYQDAHTPAVPPVSDVMTRNGPYDPPSLWVDTLAAINEAREFIYVVGWSVFCDISLIRDGNGFPYETIGEVLKRKADEGVRVLVMIWDEALSSDMYPCGLMGTHDEATRKYFEGTSVDVLLATRKKEKSKFREKLFVTTTYTHHQKCVILDAPIPDDSRRQIVAFLGGVDLTGGRWDTPQHSLFSTLNGEHKNDFYQNCLSSTPDVGPREPWHDIHMYVEGPGAQDLVINFHQRWKKQNLANTNLLFDFTPDKFDLEYSYTEEDSWTTQLFRSINSDSCFFENSDLINLKSKKGKVYDNSIQQAYIHHIRRAKRFIYIENQYFLGSSPSWKFPHLKCPHLVPIELTARITRAIEQNQSFRVYINIPMFPEGAPATAPVQEILHWQSYTVDMMYRKIAKALKIARSKAHPTDYLAFFCLGKRESTDKLPPDLQMPTDPIGEKVRKTLRHMIYIHSKMAIFDDEYIIVGSANINERSMSGNRDSELAMGSYQPQFTREQYPEEDIQGDISTFRRALWAEHCGEVLPEHSYPSSLECIQKMKEIGKQNREKYILSYPFQNDSHLISYPYDVEKDGKVKELENFDTFPDLGGSIFGSNSITLPDTLTM